VFVYPDYRNKPNSYGPRWDNLEDAPELVRPLLVEVEYLSDGVIDLFPAGVEIEASVGDLSRWIIVKATKEEFWETVREEIRKNASRLTAWDGEAETIHLPEVRIQNISGEGEYLQSWSIGLDKANNDPNISNLEHLGMGDLSFSAGADFDFAIKIIDLLRDVKAKVAAIRGGAE
jgi:hypothetical protein